MYGRGARGVVNLFRYCLCWFLFASPLALAADRVIVVEPSQLQKTYTPGSGAYAFNDSRSWSEPVSVQSGRVNLPVKTDRKFTWASFRNGLKNALKVNPASIMLNATVAGAVGAVGYLIDSNTGKLSKNLSGPASYTPTGTDFYFRAPNSTTARTSAEAAALDQVLYGGYVGPTIGACSVFAVQNPTILHCSYSATNPYNGQPSSGLVTVYRYGSTCPAGTTASTSTVGGCVAGGIQPLTDAEFTSLGDSFTSPADAAAIAPDVISAVPGSYDYHDGYEFSGPPSLQGEPVITTTTTPTGTEVSTTTPSYNFDYSSNPLSITTTTNSTTKVYNNGTLVSTTNTTNAGTVNPVQPAPELEIPTDCEFMPTVCAWLDWFKTPAPMPEPDMPQVVDDEFRQEYTVSFGGSCPAPRTVDTQFGTLSLSWQPLCDLASIIRYLVIASASLYAAFIGLGISRGSN